MLLARIDKNEKGIAMLETAAILPILISIGLFTADLFFFTKSKTDLNQVTRDAAIFFAMYPLTSGANGNMADKHVNPTWGDSCIIDPTQISEDTQTDIDECEHIATQERAYRLLEAQQSYLDVTRQTTHISTSKVGNRVQLTITADVKVSFLFPSKTITSTAILRKIV